MASISDCMTEDVLFVQKRSTVWVTNTVEQWTGWNKTIYQGLLTWVPLISTAKRDTVQWYQKLNTSNLVPNVSQSEKQWQRQKKTFKEFRLQPVAVNPWVMACPCDLMAMHFLQRSGESLSHPTTSTDTGLILLSSHLCMLCVCWLGASLDPTLIV